MKQIPNSTNDIDTPVLIKDQQKYGMFTMVNKVRYKYKLLSFVNMHLVYFIYLLNDIVYYFGFKTLWPGHGQFKKYIDGLLFLFFKNLINF